MVRVSWGGEVVIADLAPCGTTGTRDDDRGSVSSPPPFSPTSSNTPTAPTSPSYSSPSTVSPHASTLGSAETNLERAGCSSSKDDPERLRLIQELKNQFVLFGPTVHPSSEMLPLGAMTRPRYSDDDNNNNEEGERRAPEGASPKRISLEDRAISPLTSSSESLVKAASPGDTRDSIIIYRPLQEANSPAAGTINVSRTSPTKDPLLTRMLATFSDFEDDFDPIDGVESESSDAITREDTQKQVLFDHIVVGLLVCYKTKLAQSSKHSTVEGETLHAI